MPQLRMGAKQGTEELANAALEELQRRKSSGMVLPVDLEKVTMTAGRVVASSHELRPSELPDGMISPLSERDDAELAAADAAAEDAAFAKFLAEAAAEEAQGA